MDEKPLIVVSVLDPAIDTEAMTPDEMVQYFRTRELKHLKFHHGKPAQKYHLREVRQSVWESYVMAGDTEDVRYRRAFLCAVVKVENLHQRDGSILPTWEPPNARERDCMPESEAERFTAQDRAEIGRVAFDRSFLGWRTAPVYRLPPTSQQILALRAYRLVEPTPPSQAPNNSEASSEAAPQAQAEAHAETIREPSQDVSGSVGPTVVTATGPRMEVA